MLSSVFSRMFPASFSTASRSIWYSATTSIGLSIGTSASSCTTFGQANSFWAFSRLGTSGAGRGSTT